MHVWIIEEKSKNGKWLPISCSLRMTRRVIREDLSWWQKNRPQFTLRIVKYTSTKGK